MYRTTLMRGDILETKTVDCFIDKVVFLLKEKRQDYILLLWGYWDLVIDQKERYFPFYRIHETLEHYFNIKMKLHYNMDFSNINSKLDNTDIIIPGEYNKLPYRKYNHIFHPHYVLLRRGHKSKLKVVDEYPNFRGYVHKDIIKDFYLNSLKYKLPIITLEFPSEKPNIDVTKGILNIDNDLKYKRFSEWLVELPIQERMDVVKNIMDISTLVFRKNAMVKLSYLTGVDSLNEQVLQHRKEWEVVWKRLIKLSYHEKPHEKLSKLLNEIYLLEEREQELNIRLKQTIIKKYER